MTKEVEKIVTQIVEVTAAPPPVTRKGAWVDRLIFTSIDPAEAAVKQIQAGDIDVYAYSVSDPALLETTKADANMSYTTAFGSYTELTFNPVDRVHGWPPEPLQQPQDPRGHELC